MKIHETIHWERLSPSDGHYFFGYYDRIPWNSDNSLHLALKAPQAERLPQPGEKAEVGVLDRKGKFEKLAETLAWCHQQGSMTLWLKHQPESFIFNDWDEKEGKLVSRIYSLKKGLTGFYPFPVYAMSPDGRYGATLSFARIPRRGYSYADAKLDVSPPDLDRDGIFIIDMRSGKISLAASYRKIFELHPAAYILEEKHIWTNHIIFNRDSSRILFLLRHCENPREPSPWQTYMYTVNIDGSELACPLPEFYWKSMISHQIWGRTPHEVLIDANWQNKGSEYVVFDERNSPLRARRISRGMGPMGHLIFSPDGKWMLADTYPVKGIQTLALVNAADGTFREIGYFRHEQAADYPGEVRCDLHPRWSHDGTLISVDSIHDGKRGIYSCQMKDSLNT